MNGYIKAWRSMMEWEWYKDNAVKSLFMHLLFLANIKDAKWKGVDIKSGQLVTSLDSLSKDTGLSVQQIRTALTKLKSTGEITIKSTNQFSLVTIANWASYQSTTEEATNDLTTDPTNEQQTSNKRATTDREYKKKEEEKEVLIALPDKVIGLPLNDGSEHIVCSNDVEEYCQLYPAVDVNQELRNMRGWLIANSTKRKTRLGVKRFINGWLSKAQDRPHQKTNQTPLEQMGKQDALQGYKGRS